MMIVYITLLSILSHTSSDHGVPVTHWLSMSLKMYNTHITQSKKAP